MSLRDERRHGTDEGGESSAHRTRLIQLKEERGGARLRNAAPRHTSGVNTQPRSGGCREMKVSGGVTATICRDEIKSSVKTRPKSGLIKVALGVAGQTEWSETQSESSWLSESCDWPLVVAAFLICAVSAWQSSPMQSVEQRPMAASQTTTNAAAQMRSDRLSLCCRKPIMFRLSPNGTLQNLMRVVNCRLANSAK